MKIANIQVIRDMLDDRAVKYHKAKFGLKASKDGILLTFEDGSDDRFVVYKSKTPIFGCVVDNGKEYVLETFEGDKKFPKKSVKVYEL